MYVGSFAFDHKSSNLNIHTTRSQSSLSNFSTKSTASKPNLKEISKDPSEYCLEIMQLTKSKHKLEEKILDTMQEMKQLKSISKKLRDKELEKELLAENLIKEQEEISEAKLKFEKSEKLIFRLLKGCLNHDDDALNDLYLNANAHRPRLKSKRNSLILEDILYQSEINNYKSSKNLKLKSPYFQHSSLHILTTPKSKKLTIFNNKAKSRKITPKVLNENLPIHEKLQKTYNRIKSLLENLSKINK